MARFRCTAWAARATVLALAFAPGSAGAAAAGASCGELGTAADTWARARWERLRPPGLDGVTALAFDPAGQRLAVGGERGVALGPVAGPFARRLARGPVHDLAFLPDGSLLAATSAGLYRIEASGRVAALAVAPGEAARSVRALAVGGGWIAAASDAGVHITSDTRYWQRAAGLPFGTARRVAFERTAKGPVLWAVIEGSLWSWRIGAADGVRRAPVSGAREGEGLVDVVAGLGEADVVVLGARELAVYERARERWVREEPVLPPGTQPRRIGCAGGVAWMATDGGLLVAPRLAGPWRRAGPPVGHVGVSELAGADGAFFAATARGLLRVGRASAAAPAAARRAAAVTALPADPPVQQVQRVALRYLALEPERFQRLRRGAARRGWLPDLTLRSSWGRGRDRGRKYDQAFTSGALRHLYDLDSGRDEDFDAVVTLSWDLGDIRFHRESVAVSREARLVTQLRDDVLDEITQLYFERQRVLARLAAGASDPSPDELTLRAAELASGLDAWTGGWFSEQLGSAPSPSGPALPAEERRP